jgi:hypothetical protein
MHMKNVHIRGSMHHVCKFEGKVVLDSELKRNMEIGNKHKK